MANYLYNGVELPDVYSADLHGIDAPYRVIYTNGDKYKLLCCEAAFSHITENGVSYIATNGESLWEICTYRIQGSGNKIWSTSSREFDSTKLLLSAESIVWTSHDILCEDSTDIFFSATDPILVSGTETAEPTDPTSFLQSYFVGQRLAGMR